MEYSVDMIRIECSVNKDDFEKYQNRHFAHNPSFKYTQRFGFKDYSHHFVYEDAYCNFWIGYEFLLKDKVLEYSRTLVFEFNPNKNRLDGTYLGEFIQWLQNNKQGDFIVKGVEVAIDLTGVSRDSIFYDKGYRKRIVEYIEDGSSTTYRGNRGWGGVKIYDKAKEQGHHGDWVRVEFTIKLGLELMYFRGLRDIEMSIPTIFSCDFTNVKDKKYAAYLHYIQSGFATMDEFGRTIKNKLKEIAVSSSSVCIDDSIRPNIVMCIVAYIEEFVNHVQADTMPF